MLRDIQQNKRYEVIEGRHAGTIGICVNRIESSFGRVWADIQVNSRTILRKRASDLRLVPSSTRSRSSL